MPEYKKNNLYRSSLSMNQALIAFSSAQNLFKERKFFDAVIQMERYRNNINYNEFSVWDNRPKNKPILSVIIVAYATNHDLILCVKSLIKGTIKDIEIIIVDNGKNDEVSALLKEMPLVYVKAPINLLLSEGRNIGVSFARAEIAAFLDDDAIAPPTFATDVLSAFSDKKILAIRGKVVPKTKNAFRSTNSHYDLGDAPLPNVINTEGCSAWRVSPYLNEDGMDPLLFGHEGTDLSSRLAQKYGLGNTIYWPKLYIFHDFAHSQEKLLIKENRHALMHEYLQWKNPYSTQVIQIYESVKERMTHSPQIKNTIEQHIHTPTATIHGNSFPQSICIYIPTLGPGGAERQVVTLARELKRERFSVQVLCDRIDGVHGHYLPLLAEKNILVSTIHQKDYLELGKRVAQTIPDCFASVARLPIDHTTLLSLMGALSKIHPDVLHCYLDNANVLGGLAGLCTNVPRIILSTRNTTPNNLPDLAHLAEWTHPIYNFLLQHPQVSIEANSTSGAHDYAKWLGIPQKNIAVTPNGIDSATFPNACVKTRTAVRESLGIAQTAPVVIWPGKYTLIKRPLNMLAVAQIVCQKIPEVIFLAVGNPLAMTERMKEYIDKHDLASSVMLLGRRSDLPDLFCAADAMILTSQIEGFPNALAEAMLSGLPVVSTSVGAVPDIITDKVNGFIHEVGDIEGMAHSLLKLICNKKLSKEMGARGQHHIVNNFSPKNLLGNLKKLYVKN